jgi:hypothetical protein
MSVWGYRGRLHDKITSTRNLTKGKAHPCTQPIQKWTFGAGAPIVTRGPYSHKWMRPSFGWGL